jgi:DNA repair protein RadC
MHQQQPETYTAEVLAARFQLAVEKVRAILTLKKLEMERKQAGLPLNYEMAESMDKMFRNNEKLFDEEEEPRKSRPGILREPKVYADIERNRKIAQEKAKERRAEIEQREELGKVLDKSLECANRRHSYVIFDKSQRKVLVREKDGTLRNGTWDEREKIFRKFAPKELA